MQTKLSVFCEKVIEAGWLAAAIVAPLFFNGFSWRIFEPDKITLLRSIALLMLAAWIIKVLESGLSMEKRGEVKMLTVLRIPLVIPTLILAGVYILTTITSIFPRISFWGSYERLQGTYTLLSYVVIFLLTLQTLRNREQLERLITIMLLVSLPISLYGITQHYGLDPVPWTATYIKARVISSMGNPIFVAAYLVMVFPLTILRLRDSISAFLTSKDVIPPFALTASYAFLLIAQLMCIVFTKSRGPFIGLMGGLFFFFLLLAISKGRKGLALMVLALAVGVILFFVVLNLPNTPLASIREMPYIGRLGRIFGMETRTGKERILIWQGAVEMITADTLRAIVGYGPECMYTAFHPYLLPELVDMIGLGNTADRCHNEILDDLVTTGLMGFAAYLLLVGSLFYYGLKWLGLVEKPRQRKLFLALLGVGGSLGVLTPWLMEGKLSFSGVGIPMGIIAALILYLAISLLQRRERVKDSYRQDMLIALFSALVAHFIEIQFGIAIAATRTYFWLLAALMVIVALFLRKEPVQGPVRGRARRRKKRRSAVTVSPWNSPLLSHSLSVGLMLTTMGFAFINNRYPLSANSFSVPILFLLTWLFGGLMMAGEAKQKKWASFSIYSLCSLGLFFLFLIFHTPNLPPGSDPGNAIMVYYLFLFATLITIAAVLLRGLILPPRLWQPANWWLYAILIAGVAFLVSGTNLNLIRADIYHNLGLAYDEAQRWDESIAFHRQAMELAPSQDRYHFSLGKAYLGKAKSDAEGRLHWLGEARRSLEQARRINPLNPDHLKNLGLLYRYWVQATTSPEERIEKLNRSVEYYRQAMALSPHNIGRLVREDVVEEYVFLGDSYTEMGEFDQAAEAYMQAVEIDPQPALQMGLKIVEDSPDSFVAHRNLAMLYQQMGKTGKALAEAEKAKALAPQGEKAELDKLMAWMEAQGE